MTHRIFRLGIATALAQEPQLILDFDGRTSLQEVQLTLRQTLGLELEDPHYAFLLPGDASESQTRYVDPKMVGLRADKALLFRLGLNVGDRLTYVSHLGVEQRYTLTVLAINEAALALGQPRLIQMGEPLTSSSGTAGLIPLATALTTRFSALRELRSGAALPSSETEATLLEQLAALAQALGSALAQDLSQLVALERRVAHPTSAAQAALIAELLTLPLELARAGQTLPALRVADCFEFAAPDEMRGDRALIHALAGEREAALAQLDRNLTDARHRYVAEAKAGDVYRALGELDAAEVYYRRSLAEARSAAERAEATLRLTSFLIDAGRESDAAALVSDQAKSRL